MENLTQVLEDIRLEYNVAYDSYYSEALLRVIEILKNKELDEAWTSDISDSRFKKRCKTEDSELKDWLNL